MIVKYKTFILLILLLFVNSYFSYSQDEICNISIDNKLVFSTPDKIEKYNKTKITDRSKSLYNDANVFFQEGASSLENGDYTSALESFKDSYKNYKRAKVSEEALSFVYAQLALTHILIGTSRDKSKAIRFLDDINIKTISKEAKWAYNVGLIYYFSDSEMSKSKSIDFFNYSIKSDRYFFPAYEDLSCVYKDLKETKKYEKTLQRLDYQKSEFAERSNRLSRNSDKVSSSKEESRKFNNTITDGVEPNVFNARVLSDLDKMFKYEKNQEWSKQAKKKILEGKTAYQKGVNDYKEGNYVQAAKNFKLSTRRLKAAKINPASSNHANINLALSYLRSGKEREKTKAIKQISSLTKEAFGERDILYNIAMTYYDVYKNGGKRDKGKIDHLESAIENFQSAIKQDKYFLTPYLNLLHIYSEDKKDEKMVNKIDRKYKKNKYALTDIYKEYVLNGDKYKNVDLSFLDNSIFRIYLGTYDKYNLPEDIYLHDNLITLSHEGNSDSYIMGTFYDFKEAHNYMDKILRMPVYQNSNVHIIAFKEGIRTDFE